MLKVEIDEEKLNQWDWDITQPKTVKKNAMHNFQNNLILNDEIENKK